MSEKKILSDQDLDIFAVKKKKVLVGGCFDVFHIGHLRFLESAKRQGDLLIVALESDEFIRTKKNRHPFHNQAERAEILSHLDCVDFVIMLSYLRGDDDYMALVKRIKPEIIAITENDKLISKKANQAKAVGGELVVVTPFIGNKSSIDLLKAIKKLD
ncbi:hypothetical protein A3J15_02505 [Candidatus Roizmanbacteria bacterium RIFCSPLOWO2_02_FULL_38_10]|uniref:Cytidyltransferase-like domain-containing protein n=1 Tax=Candidatus Roizmanbacteria bacterium RIFCSPLOWO2_02_FULL_38_10 TaxID=1802074 RepID=A0A1F7JNE6_9BACT|nr:MAG: hypothetical protein A3J15_02505 [Candidatus Roizmanbacteria bacterium RIFCSPLOWO2_02_FULL_38_10]